MRMDEDRPRMSRLEQTKYKSADEHISHMYIVQLWAHFGTQFAYIPDTLFAPIFQICEYHYCRINVLKIEPTFCSLE